MTAQIKHTNLSELSGIPEKKRSGHPDYEFSRRDIVPMRGDARLRVSVYEIPPGKSAYPYHYHVKNEEVFLIIKGRGVLRTPEGRREVRAGDIVFFPAEPSGAHKLTNSSAAEGLLYVDVGVCNDLDAAVYPDSGKIGIWGMGINKVFSELDERDYYDGE